MATESISADALAIILRELGLVRQPGKNAARRWIREVNTELELYQAQREEAAVDDSITMQLKHFETLSHLLWWTLCNAAAYASEDAPTLARGAFVPGHADYDNFLSLMPKSHYARDESGLGESLCSLLNTYDTYQAVHKKAFPDEDEEVTDETRDNVVDLMQAQIETTTNAVDSETLAQQLELGCNLYASMIATVESSQDALSLRRWRECYLAKVRTILAWLGQTRRDDPIWSRANTEPDIAILVPFTKREDLFERSRKAQANELQARVKADQERYDVDNDHTAIESEFECPNCGSFHTQSFLIQMRSADEPMTQLWKCWSCKKSGREN